MPGATTRATDAGQQTAQGIIQTVHLMYQNHTALSYLRSLIRFLQEEAQRREKEEVLKGLEKMR